MRAAEHYKQPCKRTKQWHAGQQISQAPHPALQRSKSQRRHSEERCPGRYGLPAHSSTTAQTRTYTPRRHRPQSQHFPSTTIQSRSFTFPLSSRFGCESTSPISAQWPVPVAFAVHTACAPLTCNAVCRPTAPLPSFPVPPSRLTRARARRTTDLRRRAAPSGRGLSPTHAFYLPA